jgi:hypothetical protein
VFGETAFLILFAGTTRTGVISSCLPTAHLLRKDELASGGLVSFKPFLELLPSDPISAANSLGTLTLNQIEDGLEGVP